MRPERVRYNRKLPAKLQHHVVKSCGAKARNENKTPRAHSTERIVPGFVWIPVTVTRKLDTHTHSTAEVEARDAPSGVTPTPTQFGALLIASGAPLLIESSAASRCQTRRTQQNERHETAI